MAKCTICPYQCDLQEGQTGRCRSRTCINGRIVADSRLSTVAIDPIEKRPLFHFRPGRKYLSVGFYGCTYTCQFCFNHSISQTAPSGGVSKTTAELVADAVRRGCDGIAFSYNEPTVCYEYITEAASLARAAGLRSVLKTNGFVLPAIAEALSLVFDAVNIDIKGIREDYESFARPDAFDRAMEAISIISQRAWVEVSYLIPARLAVCHPDNFAIAESIASVGSNIPVHLLRMYQAYRLTGEPYTASSVRSVLDSFKSAGLKYVYVSNAFTDGLAKLRDTFCHKCGQLMVSRQSCPVVLRTSCCGATLPGHF